MSVCLGYVSHNKNVLLVLWKFWDIVQKWVQVVCVCNIFYRNHHLIFRMMITELIWVLIQIPFFWPQITEYFPFHFFYLCRDWIISKWKLLKLSYSFDGIFEAFHQMRNWICKLQVTGSYKASLNLFYKRSRYTISTTYQKRIEIFANVVYVISGWVWK